MDSSPSKRRRTSPSTSVAVTVENTYLGTLPQNGASPSKRRSSLMSPTKASLARFYPSLLSRAKSAEPTRHISQADHTVDEQHSAREGGKNGTVAYIPSTATERSKSGANGVEDRQGQLVTPRRGSQTPGEVNSFAKLGQAAMNPGLRASPPEEERCEGTAVSGTNGGQQEPVAEAIEIGSTAITIVPDSQNPRIPSTPTQRAPHVPTSGMGIGEDGEPSLPSTPLQLGLEPSPEKARGPLLISPSKRPRRKGRSSAKSSPLKPAEPPPEHSNQTQKTLVASLGPRCYIAGTPKPHPPLEEARLSQMRTRLSDLERQLEGIEDKLLRKLLVSSWQQDRIKDGKDTAKRRNDIVRRSTKIVQLRDEILRVQAERSLDQDPARQEMIDQKVAPTKSPTLTQRLAAFLPFAIRPPSEPRPPSPKDQEVNQVLDLDNLQTTADPFTITTSNKLLLPSAADKNLLQRQEVTMSTAHQSLTCDLQLTTDLATQQISHLDVQALSSWAEPELGAWLRQSHEKLELPALGSALGRYWELANLRSECWINCKQDFKDLVANALEPDDPLSHLGLQDLIFARRNVRLKVHWGISLSDRGEVESHGSASGSFPPSWQQQQQEAGGNGSSELAKIGDAFEMLVEDRGGIGEAVGVLCRVVFPT